MGKCTMKISIALAAADHDYKKGDRVIVKVAKDEWYLGSVVRAGAKIKIDFDDGASAVIEAEDFKDVRWMKKATKTLKRKATDAEAKEWSDAKRPVAAPEARTAKEAKKVDKDIVDPVETPGRVVEAGLIRLRHNRGDGSHTKRIEEFVDYLKHTSNSKLFDVTQDASSRVMLRIVGDRIGLMCRIKFVFGSKDSLKLSYSNHIVSAMRKTEWDAGIAGLDPGSRLEPLISAFGKVQSVIVPPVASGPFQVQPIVARFIADWKRLVDLNYKPVSGYQAAGLAGDLMRTAPIRTMQLIKTPSQDATWAERREVQITIPKGFPSPKAAQVLARYRLTIRNKVGGVVTLTRKEGDISVTWKAPVKDGASVVITQHK